MDDERFAQNGFMAVFSFYDFNTPIPADCKMAYFEHFLF